MCAFYYFYYKTCTRSHLIDSFWFSPPVTVTVNWTLPGCHTTILCSNHVFVFELESFALALPPCPGWRHWRRVSYLWLHLGPFWGWKWGIHGHWMLERLIGFHRGRRCMVDIIITKQKLVFNREIWWEVITGRCRDLISYHSVVVIQSLKNPLPHPWSSILTPRLFRPENNYE